MTETSRREHSFYIYISYIFFTLSSALSAPIPTDKYSLTWAPFAAKG